jgi:hypothetical protein
MSYVRATVRDAGLEADSWNCKALSVLPTTQGRSALTHLNARFGARETSRKTADVVSESMLQFCRGAAAEFATPVPSFWV